MTDNDSNSDSDSSSIISIGQTSPFVNDISHEEDDDMSDEEMLKNIIKPDIYLLENILNRICSIEKNLQENNKLLLEFLAEAKK